MFKLENWKKPLYKKDVIGVLIYGCIAAILGGILAGLLDFLFGSLLNFPVSFSLLITSYMIGIWMRKGYQNYHILYPVLSIFFMLFARIFTVYSFLFCAIPHISTFRYFLVWNLYASAFFGPFYSIIGSIRALNFMNLILEILNLALYIFSFCICYRLVQRRN